MAEQGVFVEVHWIANMFRGEEFEAIWLPMAEAVIDYGATYWALLRAKEGGLDFRQHAIFPAKSDFERYWYSRRVAEARTQATGLFQVPLLPTFHEILASGRPAAAAHGGAP